MIDHVAFFQLTGDVFHRDTQLDHQHQHMIGQVADLVDRLGFVLLQPRDDDLGAFLSDLFRIFSSPLSNR